RQPGVDRHLADLLGPLVRGVGLVGPAGGGRRHQRRGHAGGRRAKPAGRGTEGGHGGGAYPAGGAAPVAGERYDPDMGAPRRSEPLRAETHGSSDPAPETPSPTRSVALGVAVGLTIAVAGIAIAFSIVAIPLFVVG